ncbi:SixA phosphatase family protein [Shimia sp.]|uniref:SixA phosphatase family protein n=1 Tax=Shimia sp. TaxID=1954381 RepID=UPI003B8C176A
MSRTLILTRHAKSSWDDPLQPDHARPLNKRGRTAARALGGWLETQGYLPQELLCSSAARTRETWARMRLLPQEQRYEDSLYLAGPDTLLQVLHTAQAATVMLIAHNPGIATLASLLASTTPKHPRFFDYPTGATTVFQFDQATWGDVRFGTGQVIDFIVPKEIDT